MITFGLKKNEKNQGSTLKASTVMSDHKHGSDGQGDQERAKRGQHNKAEIVTYPNSALTQIYCIHVQRSSP